MPPTMEDKVRAEQFYRGNTKGKKAMFFLLYSDNKFAGQNVVIITQAQNQPDCQAQSVAHVQSHLKEA